MSTSERRSSVRTGVVWDAVAARLEPGARVVDIGGGTGGFAVRLAQQGHAVTVVDPSPDALAALGRRADEAGVADLVTGVQGDLTDLGTHRTDRRGRRRPLPRRARGGARPRRRAAHHRRRARRGGAAQPARRPAARRRRGPGDGRPLPAGARASSTTRPRRDEARRYTADEVTALLADAGFTVEATQAVRVFADLVPGSLLDLEPGSTAALVDLERAVAGRPEYLPLATQVHLLATH